MDILSSKGFDFDKFDIASDPDKKAEMRKMAGNERALPPQLAVGEKFLGVSFVCVVFIVSTFKFYSRLKRYCQVTNKSKSPCFKKKITLV